MLVFVMREVNYHQPCLQASCLTEMLHFDQQTYVCQIFGKSKISIMNPTVVIVAVVSIVTKFAKAFMVAMKV